MTSRAFIKENKETNLLLVDALNLAFRYIGQSNFSFSDKYVSTLKSLARSYDAAHIVVACDKGSSTYRKEILPEYKMNRKEKHEQRTDKEKADFEAFFDEFRVAMDMVQEDDAFVFLQYQGVEADDIAGHIVTNLDLTTEKTWLISSDRDWDLLISPKVSRFSYVTREEITWDTWEDKYGELPPEFYLTYKCLVGDPGDNIKGIEGVGPKRAQSIIETYGDIFDIIGNLPLSGTTQYIKNLNKSEDLLMKNIQLMDLATFCTDAIGADNVLDINSTLQAKGIIK